MTKQEKIVYDYIKNNPGCRHREISKISLIERLVILDVLVNKGMIRSEPYADRANMEFYDKWYVVE